MGIVVCKWQDRIEFRNPGTLRMPEDFKFEQTTLIMPTVDLTAGVSTLDGGVKGGVKTTTDQILELIEVNPSVTYQKTAQAIGVTENAITKQIKRLVETNQLRRVGPKKGGHWEIVKPQA